MTRPPYVYLLIREDLDPVSRLVQASHAALEAGFDFGRPPGAVHLIALGVRDERELLREAAQLEARGIAVRVFFEPDHGVGHSALATEPLRGAARAAMRRYRLLESGGGARKRAVQRGTPAEAGAG